MGIVGIFVSILGLALVGALLATIILPWVNRAHISQLEQKLKKQQQKLQQLEIQLQHYRGQTVDAPPPASPAVEKITESPVVQPSPVVRAALVQPQSEALVRAISVDTASGADRFEKRFGVNLPVWIGAAALALSGVFLVKYSIESGLLSPSVRLVMGGLFGVGLIQVAEWVRRRPGLADAARIAQALTGAGIGVLYASLYASAALYHLISNVAGFSGMAAVTALAILLSLRHGMAIAALGLCGGLLTPALIGSDQPDAVMMFSYLYAITLGVVMVIRHRGWWVLALPAVAGVFLWLIVWLFLVGVSGYDGMVLSLFLMALCATMATLLPPERLPSPTAPAPAARSGRLAHYASFSGSILLMALVTVESDFSWLEWGLFGLLSAACLVLGYFKEQHYGHLAWLSFGSSICMLLLWGDADMANWLALVGLFGSMHTVAGYAAMWRSAKPLHWAWICASAIIGYYLLAYSGYTDRIVTASNSKPALLPDWFWSALAILLALLTAWITARVQSRFESSHASKQLMLALFCAAAVAALSLAIAFELKSEWLSLAVAIEIIALAWINNHTSIDALRRIMAALLVVFGLLLLPQIELLIQLSAYSLLEAKLQLQDHVPLVDWPLLQLGVPSVLFIGAAIQLMRQRDDHLVAAFEIAAIALIATMGYYELRHWFHIDADVLFVKASFVERGVITAVLSAYALGCLMVGRYYQRRIVGMCGGILLAAAWFRTGYFDLLIDDPVSHHHAVGSWPLFNALALTYASPIGFILLAYRELQRMGWFYLARIGQIASFILALAFVSLSIRHGFHGNYLDAPTAEAAEIYSYSLGWLVMGIVLVYLGTARRNQILRIASLVVMILSIGKVFLYDAAELEGLLRVISFFGLGLCLLGLSWFYSRFIFATPADAADASKS